MANEPVVYKRITLYEHDRLQPGFTNTVFPDKDSVMDKLREMKSRLGEPRLGFIENEKADVLSFRFPDTPIFGRIIFSKRDLEEFVHCPGCGVAFKRVEDGISKCCGWYCNWIFDHDDQVWRVHTITKEVKAT